MEHRSRWETYRDIMVELLETYNGKIGKYKLSCLTDMPLTQLERIIPKLLDAELMTVTEEGSVSLTEKGIKAATMFKHQKEMLKIP